MCSMISRKRKTIFKLRPNIVPTRSTIRGTVSQGYRAPGAPRSSPSTTSSSLISSLGAGAWKGRVRSSRAPNLTPWFQTHCWISPNQTLLFVTKESVPKKKHFPPNLIFFRNIQWDQQNCGFKRRLTDSNYDLAQLTEIVHRVHKFI